MEDKQNNPLTQSFFNQFKMFKKIDSHTITFLIFVVISAILWFLNALSKTYSTEISIPVQFTWMSNNYMLHSPAPKQFSLQINGTGFTILRYKAVMPLAPFKFDISSYFAGQNDSLINVTIVTQFSKKQIEQYFNESIVVDDIEPKNINATFSKMTFKKVAVRFVGDLKFAPQYWVKGDISISPDSIVIGGPKRILDTVCAIYTRPIQKKDIRQQIVKNIEIDDKGIFHIKNHEVKVVINVEKYTETSLRLPVTIINEPAKTNVMLFPDNATVKFLISIQECENIDMASFQLVADFSQINYNSDKEQIKIDLITYPETVKILSINPREATFVISVKK